MIGGMRARLTLQAAVDTASLDGGATRVFADVADVWAAIEPIAGDAAFAADRAEDVAMVRVTLRWRADVLEGQRFVDGARMLVIRSKSDPDGRRRFLVCRCQEISA